MGADGQGQGARRWFAVRLGPEARACGERVLCALLHWTGRQGPMPAGG